MWRNISGETVGESWNWTLLGVKGLSATQIKTDARHDCHSRNYIVPRWCEHFSRQPIPTLTVLSGVLHALIYSIWVLTLQCHPETSCITCSWNELRPNDRNARIMLACSRLSNGRRKESQWSCDKKQTGRNWGGLAPSLFPNPPNPVSPVRLERARVTSCFSHCQSVLIIRWFFQRWCGSSTRIQKQRNTK